MDLRANWSPEDRGERCRQRAGEFIRGALLLRSSSRVSAACSGAASGGRPGHAGVPAVEATISVEAGRSLASSRGGDQSKCHLDGTRVAGYRLNGSASNSRGAGSFRHGFSEGAGNPAIPSVEQLWNKLPPAPTFQPRWAANGRDRLQSATSGMPRTPGPLWPTCGLEHWNTGEFLNSLGRLR